jgi:TonB-linked SusC/RagA family outer membrane protein
VNPYISTLNEVNDRFSTTIQPNFYLNYKINNDFTLRLTAGANIINSENDIFHNSKTNSGSPLTSYGATYGVNGSVSNANVSSFVNENTLSYNKKLNSGDVLNAVVGYTQQFIRGSNYGFAATNLPNESLGIKGIGQGTPYSVSSAAPPRNGQLSYLARVNYTFKTNYLFTASFRADGSSKFAPDKRWGYFPSGAVAWRFGNETFMKKLPFIADAKLRASYGVTGNNRVSDFPFLTQLTANTSTFSGSYYSFNETNVYNIVLSSMANKNLKWETGYQTDIGLDLTLLNGRIVFEADYYKKITDNLLLNAAMPYTTGFTNAFVNIGKVSNEGLEFSLTTTNIKKPNFNWTSSVNITFNRNRVLALTSGQDALLTTRSFDASVGSVANYIAKVGQPVAQFYGYIADGMYQVNDFYKVPNGATGNYFYVLKEGIPYYGTKSTLGGINTTISSATSVQPGDPKFKDLNGDGLLDQNDYTGIGNPYPVHYGGFNNNFSYKGFDLSIFCQWSYGNDILNANRIKMEGGTSAPQAGTSATSGNLGNVNTNQYATYADRWTFENPSNLYPRANAFATGTRTYSTRIVEDGSYLRLKTVQLGYNLPVTWTKRLKISNARLYVSAQNLVTFTGYSGPDPEVSTASGNNLTPGFDYSPYPRTRVITIGANINL